MATTRQFGNHRPSIAKRGAVHSHAPLGNERFQPLPTPTGKPPYRLDLTDILGESRVSAIQDAGQIAFHIVGDTGGVKYPVPQQRVADAMEGQLTSGPVKARPVFFYHLGDVVYYNGEATEYYPQFYAPYENYNVPIFAIPGNHDGDPGQTGTPSLEAYMRNFCASNPAISSDAGDVNRDTMTQPNCYFTLEAPFVTIIGLYSNVPEGGRIEQDQADWFVNELKAAPKGKALLVAVHHPAYSLDDHHSGSKAICDLLDQSFKSAGRVADAVFTGHVHNFQRFTRKIGDKQVPYIVAGGGGYWNLHHMRKADDGEALQTPVEVPDENVTLENYVDDHHGFMTLTVDDKQIHGEFYSVPNPRDPGTSPAQRDDAFTVNWKDGTLVIDRGSWK